MTEQRDERSEKEIERRRDAVLKRMLKTPPKPHSEMKGESKKKRGKRPSKNQSRA